MRTPLAEREFLTFINLYETIHELENVTNCLVVSLHNIVKTECADNDLSLKNYINAANKIIDDKYNDLYTPNVIALYTYLEAVIKDTIKGLLKYFGKEFSTNKQLSKLKITFFDFFHLNEEEKYDYLYNAFEREFSGNEKYGTQRFKNLFKPFDFELEIDPNLSKDIVELAQVRNCLIHRMGIVDRMLLDECPWMKERYQLGEKMKFNQDVFHKYAVASIHIAGEIDRNIRSFLGSKFEEELQAQDNNGITS